MISRMLRVDGVATSPAEAAPAAESKLSGAHWLPVVEPHLSSALVKPDQRRRIQALASVLPHNALYALEVPLAATTHQVDFSLRLDRTPQFESVASLLPPGHRRDLLASWGMAGRSATQPIPEVWLEFDLQNGLQTAVPEPLVCVRLLRDFGEAWFLHTLLPQLLGQRPCPRLEERVRACLGALDPKTKLLYAFDLSARPGQMLRLEIYGSEWTALIDYCRRLSTQAAEQLSGLRHICGDGDRYHLSFDLDANGRLAERLGIEISYRRLPHREPRWRRLFDRLVEAGLCRAAELPAIFQWPGSDSAVRSKHWPPGATAGHCARCVSHVKLVTWPDRAPRAKVYLLFQQVAASAAKRTA